MTSTSNPLAELESTILEEDAHCSRMLAALIWKQGSPEHKNLVQRARKLEVELKRREPCNG